MYDTHAHSTYSDGSFLAGMVDAATAAGLEGIGFADHCSVSGRPAQRDARDALGFNLDRTYERRRRAISRLRERADITVYDAVEMDYDPRDDERIAAFLESADFQYAIGSVHFVDDLNVQHTPNFTDLPEATLGRLVDGYFDTLIEMLESGHFDIAAHPDLIERTPPLAGRATDDHYRRAARAFADSRTIPEINAGRACSDTELVHPAPRFLECLLEHDVPVILGTDSHHPDEFGPRVEFLETFTDRWGLEAVTPAAVLE
ncbi:PHP domain-containing protein [Natronobiforma cellulositropha]|uniref:PHP domain-containing protein n=1 Tax=Natronobiforma cellulositropha TaxID=1679076 RepID=UPI0021D591E8|nr:PHP domain-containing protein [Natronobiforma cellulositropha]